MYGVIRELGGYTRPGSTRIYESREQAEKVAKRYINKTERVIKKLKDIKIAYGDIYGNIVTWRETADYSGSESGGGFYQAFNDIWSTADPRSTSRTLGWLFDHMNDTDKPGIKNLIKSISEELSDPFTDYRYAEGKDIGYAVAVLNDYYNAELF